MSDLPTKPAVADEKANLDADAGLVSDANTVNTAELSDKAEAAPGDAPATEEFKYISGLRLYTVTGAVTLVVFLMLLDMSIIGTAVPRITTEFQSLGDVGWYGAAYNLSSAALQPLTGKIYTYFKVKWSFLAFLAVFTFGSLICGVANSSNMLIGGRAIAGIGTSGLQNGGLTIISNSVPLEQRPALIGILMGISQLGIVSGPLMGGAITQYSTWRWCFYINLPAAAVVAALLVMIDIPERPPAVQHSVLRTLLSKMDLSGFALFAPAAIMLLLGLEYGGRSHPWNSATVIGLLVGSVATFVVFFFWEGRQGDEAMFPLGMIKRREVWTSLVTTMLIMGAVVLVNAFYLPIYFQSVKGVSPFTSGVYVLPNILSSLIFSVVSGLLVTKLGYYIPWVLGSAALSAIACGLLSTLSISTSTGEWVGYQLILGARGAAMQMPLLAVQAVLPQSQISVGMALIVFANTFGGAIFLTVAQTIFTNSLRKHVEEYAPTIDLQQLLDAGASGIRGLVSEADLPGVLRAYSESVDQVFYLLTAASICAFIAGWGMGWYDLRKKKLPLPGSAEA
ncbi:major facilitator superfamily-domain-containing protein [Lasiosphaeris hirsuta]|uniref:Major facilitator superfamily-domain-containing protein n=1 Tax=Lasiosphaeris hirsuta TaxID=260670 RepID=A0AA40AI77_9PEZI|nr:major facilitator superfamily-domain-containing protein [Lasiosphaeris hirsuta]